MRADGRLLALGSWLVRGRRAAGAGVSALAAMGLVLLLSGAPARAETPAEAFAAAESLFQRGAYEEALTAYRDFAARFSDDWRATQARFTAGFILQKKLRQPAQAREAYENVIRHDEANPLARNARFHIAEAYEQAGDAERAVHEYEKFLKKAGRHPREAEVKRKLEFLGRRAEGQPSEPPGWAYKLERKQWRRNQPPADPAEKRQRLKTGGKAGRPKSAESSRPGETAPTPPTPPPNPEQDNKEVKL